MRATAVFLLVLVHLGLCQGWTCTEGPPLNNSLQVDAALGQVVAIDNEGQSYFLTGSSWTRLPFANLKHISVGKAGLWGTNIADKAFYQYVGGNWVRFAGSFNRVDAGGNGYIVGNRYGANHVYCLRSEYKDNALTVGVYGQSRVVSTYYLSCGPLGCWSMIRRHQILFNGVDAALGQVVAIDNEGQSYCLTGSSWTRLPFANLKHISVGKAGLWGTNIADKAFYQYVGGNWVRFAGSFNRVDAGGNGYIVGNRYGANHVYCLRSEYKDNALTVGVYGQSRVVSTYYLSCGPLGCWSMIRRHQILFNGLKSANCEFSSWTSIGGGSFLMVEVGTDGRVFAVNMSGQVYERTGISEARPQGTGWTLIPLCKLMRQVAYDLGTLYGVSTDGAVVKCTA